MSKIWGIHKWDILKLICGSIFIDTEQTSGYISKQTSGCETNCMNEMPPPVSLKKKKRTYMDICITVCLKIDHKNIHQQVISEKRDYR